MLGGEPTAIPFSTEALKANLLRLQNEWATVQASHHRDAIYRYLASVFELVLWWDQESKAVNRARRALQLRWDHSDREPEPFAAVILCTADLDQVDDRTRSKWSRVLRYAAEHKDLDEPLRNFIKRKGGINSCAARALMVPAFGVNGDVAEANQDRHDDGRVDGEDSRCDASSLSQIANAPNAAWWLARARHAAAPFASTENREPRPTAELTSMR